MILSEAYHLCPFSICYFLLIPCQNLLLWILSGFFPSVFVRDWGGSVVTFLSLGPTSSVLLGTLPQQKPLFVLVQSPASRPTLQLSVESRILPFICLSFSLSGHWQNTPQVPGIMYRVYVLNTQWSEGWIVLAFLWRYWNVFGDSTASPSSVCRQHNSSLCGMLNWTDLSSEFFKQGFKDSLPCSMTHAGLIAT